MGCFLGCFGLSKNRKRRKPSNRISSRDQIHGSYHPLDSDLRQNQESRENSNISKSNPSCSEVKEKSTIKIIKKVTFNLNVKTYEPLPSADFTESDDDECEEIDEYFNNSESSAYPEDYRYHNCIEDEDDLETDERSDTEEEDTDGDDEEYEEKDMEITEEIESCSATMVRRYSSMTGNVGASLDQELKKLGMNSKATRDRSEYVFSVLNPVENLTQWKAVKAKSRQPPKQQNKENIPCPNQTKPLLQDDAVNESLSNWLVFSKAGPNATV